MKSFKITPECTTVNIPDVLHEAFGISKSEARRKIKEGGVRIDGVKLQDLDWFEEGDITCALGDFRFGPLQLGKKNFIQPVPEKGWSDPIPEWCKQKEKEKNDSRTNN